MLPLLLRLLFLPQALINRVAPNLIKRDQGEEEEEPVDSYFTGMEMFKELNYVLARGRLCAVSFVQSQLTGDDHQLLAHCRGLTGRVVSA